MHDSIAIPSCFGDRHNDDDADDDLITRAGQSVCLSLYQTKLAGECRLISVTWCKDLLLHGLSVSVQGLAGDNEYRCKVELKPWYFWRKIGSKQFMVEGKRVNVVWDLRTAKFNGETEPKSDYYVAIVDDEEVVLLVGDQKKDAYRRTGCRPALIDPILVSRKEHVFGKRIFFTRIKLEKFHEISIECKNGVDFDHEMEIRVDGFLAFHVKHLQWKFRGNDVMNVSKTRVEVYWDVHDWLFGSGLRHGLFIFKPVSWSNSPFSLSSIQEVNYGYGSSGFNLFLHAWKEE